MVFALFLLDRRLARMLTDEVPEVTPFSRVLALAGAYTVESSHPLADRKPSVSGTFLANPLRQLGSAAPSP